MKIAVIGAGPAAAGVCLGLVEADPGGRHDIVVYDIGKPANRLGEAIIGNPPPWDKDVYRHIHAGLREIGKGFVPEKSHFGSFPRKYAGNTILRSDGIGGLSKYWGASFLPFTHADMQEWPFGARELSPYYGKLLRHLRITGEHDAMSRHFTGDWFNEEPIGVPFPLERMRNAIQSSGSAFIAGTPRLALSTTGANGCTHCGHCFYGCYNESIYTADQTIRQLAGQGKLRYVPGKRMLHYTRRGGSVQIQLGDAVSGAEETASCDKLYLAAGCVETTRIVGRSTGHSSFPLLENPMFQVPLVYTGSLRGRSHSDIVALHNVLLGRLPGGGLDAYIHMQVYPLNVYLWNHAFSKVLGDAGLALSVLAQRTLGQRVYMMLFYFHGDDARGSRLTFTPDGLNAEFTYRAGLRDTAVWVLRELNDGLHRSGMHVLTPLAAQLPPGGSHHYAGTLPAMAGAYANASACEREEGIYICDSASFPSLPAQNHSFTIMANAYRIGEQSLV